MPIPQLSGQVNVTSAGTAVQFPSIVGDAFAIIALKGNTGNVYIGNDGADDVTSSNGYELEPGKQIIIELHNLNALWVDAATSGDDVAWLRIA